jgi:hypothetical protein
MKTGSIVRLLACGALLALGVTFASAQMRANIPFDFSASGSNLIAGEYTLETTGDTNQVLQMCNLRQHACVLMIASQVESKAHNDPGKLVFNRYGDQYFLSQIWSRSLVRTLPQDRRERQLAKSGAEPVVAVIAAELTSRARR